VPEDQFSLAIGRGGQNSRLAAKLTGYGIDIKLIGPDGEEVEREERKPQNALDEKDNNQEAVEEEKLEVEEENNEDKD
jgi:N utilization substance protein A